MKETYVIGLMSGTSLDGLDLAYVKFTENEEGVDFAIIASDTYPYTEIWEEKLRNAYHLGKENVKEIDEEFGRLLALKTAQFIEKNNITKIDLIASHGQTIYHQPDKGYSVQIGNGQELANILRKPVIFDFRTQDVQLGGQGAPLVPIGDQILFSKHEACLNLGGFANISLVTHKQRIAFDIVPVNIVFNELANRLNLKFDEGGKIAESGALIPELLDSLNNLDFFNQSLPKSLGFEWVEKNVLPNLKNHPVADLMHTYAMHVSHQINKVIEEHKIKNLLITGGGAYNDFLIKNIRQTEIIIPDNQTINYKEAIIFALLGYLRFSDKINVLSSVTGALKDHSSGKIAIPS